MQGFILLHRRMLSHPLYPKDRAFTQFEAWIDLLFMAAYVEHVTYLDGKPVTINIGEIPTSITKLAKRWGWTWRRVRTFVFCLQNDTAISTTNSTPNCTTLKLNNYGRYQLKDEGDNTANSTAHSIGNDTTHSTTPRRHLNKGFKKGVNKINSASAADESANTKPNDPLWGDGLQLLMRAGQKEASARRLLGRLIKDHGKVAVVDALTKAQAQQSPDPVSFIQGVLRTQGQRQPIGLACEAWRVGVDQCACYQCRSMVASSQQGGLG